MIEVSQSNMEYEFLINPMGKPRMTQRDKWLNPPRVPILKHRIAKQGMQTYALMNKCILQEKFKITFVLAMPNSWSKKKKALMDGEAHRQKPDIDNLLKFVLDALLPEGDECVHEICAKKIWGYEGKITIEQHDNTEEQTRTDTTDC